MTTATGWVKQPSPAVGLDHLGSQAPCINLYGRLLPGITNVTDRARYYSFYPWFFWAYEKEYSSLKWDEVVERYRRADCLFSLIAARHANQTDRDDDNHGIAMIGRNTLVKALNTLEEGSPIFLSSYSTRESDNPNRYFKNILGGLGQYYIGTFKELGILDGNSRIGIKYIKPRAEKIAEAMDAGVERKLFFETIESDEISTEVLDELKSFCPCQLPFNSNEQSILIDLFFDRNNIYGDEGQKRRHTLCMLMHLIDEIDKTNLKDPVLFDHFLFRGAVYSGYLPKEDKWAIPLILKDIQKGWAIYQRNELLSIAMQAIFWVVLRVLSESDTTFFSSDFFIQNLVKSKLLSEALGKRKSVSFTDSLKATKANIPELSAWEDNRHECFIGRELFNNCSNYKADPPYEAILQDALKIILILAARIDPDSSPYGSLEFPESYFIYYPINLQTFQSNALKNWHKLSLQEIVAWLAQKWGIETHLRVALRKLRRDKIDTFRVRPTDEGLKVVDIPEPVFTAPRFRQGLRVLRDISAIETGSLKGSFKLTNLGRKLMEEMIGN